MNKNRKTVMAALALGLQACVPYYNSQATLEALAVAECADARRDSSAFNRRKSIQLVQQECEQFLLLDRDYQRSQNKKFHAHPRLTYNDEQAYFDDEAWSLVTERIRVTFQSWRQRIVKPDVSRKSRVWSKSHNPFVLLVIGIYSAE